MIVDELKKAILQIATEGKIVYQNFDFIAKLELEEILKEQKEDKKYIYNNIEIPPFSIPNNWIWVKLEDICLKITDGTHSTPKYSSSGIPFISVKDVSNGCINFDNTKFITESEHKILFSRCNPEYGDLLITKIGTTGVPAIIETKDEFSLFVSVALLKFNQKLINNKWLYYFLKSPIVQNQVKENTRGVGNKNWVLDAIKNTLLPLPPVEEQQRIVDKIEELFSKLDEISSIEGKLNAIKAEFPNEMRKAILKNAFLGKLTKNDLNDFTVCNLESEIKTKQKNYNRIINNEIPKNWKEFEFKDLFEIVNGFTPLRTNNDFWNKNEIPWFTVDDIRRQGRFIYSTEQYITHKALGNSTKRLLPKDTVLLCCTASVGEYAYTNIELTTNQQFNGLIIKDNLKNYILPMYLFEYVKTLKNKLIDKSGKTTFNFLSTKKLEKFTIPIPPIEEQQRIVDKLEQLLPLCDNIEKIINGKEY